MDRRTSIADHVLPRAPRVAVAPPTVPSFEELWPDDVLETAAVTPAPGAPAAPAAPLASVAPLAPVSVADDTDTTVADDAVAPIPRSDVRPLVAVPPLAEGVVTPARELTAFPANLVETREARVRLATPAADPAEPAFDGVAGAEGRDPREARMLGVKHEARHLAARTDLDGLHEMMRQLIAAGGSDLHLTVGVAPTLRVHGDLRRITDHAAMTATEIEGLLRGVTDGAQWHTFETTHELDLAYTAPGIGRFRVNLYRQRGVPGAAFRAIPTEIPELHTLGLPPQVEQFAGLPRGLVLVTGPTGSGKSTTLAALLALANRTRAPHIVTIEDPVEFVHEHGHGLVNQREVGGDTASFAAALKHALRQDPDVILVGELRDLETTATALTAAETGHLVFATLHTQSAAQTVNRVIDIFPAHQQSEIRAQLASTLRGVVTQSLAPRADGTGRAVVAEVMVATPAIRALIREGKTHQIPSFLQSGMRDGMVAFDHHLAQRVRAGVIAYDRALTLCHSPEDFARLARTVTP